MLKIGIIGFGYMGNFHLKKVRKFEDARVLCAFDTAVDKLENAKKEGLDTFDNLDDFLKQDIELVVIATPNQWHAPYAIAAMKAGKNVMCEKPATMSVKELDDIIECSRQTGKFFTAHYQRRWDPDYRAVCDVIKSGRIGKVTTIESSVLGERGVCFGWRADPESGGGMLYDWGVHLIDQILMLYKECKVVSVYARLLSILTPAVDDFFEITMMLSNGVCAKIVVGTFSLQKLPRWFVFGDRGTMKLDDFSGQTGGLARIKEQVKGFDSVVGQKVLGPSRTMAPLQPDMLEKLEIPTEDNMEMEYWDNLIKAAKGAGELYVTTEQIRRQMLVLEAAFESAERNEVIKVEI